MATKANKFAAMLVDTATVPRPRRGRVAVVDSDMVDALSIIEPNKSLNLGPDGADIVVATADKELRGTIGQKIRNHWKLAHKDGSKCSITWSQDQPFVTKKVTA